MQNTRLNRLVDAIAERLTGWLRNPWRRLSVMMISLLFGNFLGNAFSTVAGQLGTLDIYAAAGLTIGVELISRLVYRRRPEAQSSWVLDASNALKIGVIYSLFVEAFKLGS